MSISPHTQLFMEARAICLLSERGRESFLEPAASLIQTIAGKLAPYASEIAAYGKPPAMRDAWEVISNETGSRTGQINLDMLDIAKIYDAAKAYLASPEQRWIDAIQSARTMLRSQAFPPTLRTLGEQAAIATAQPDFKKGSFTPTL